MKQLIFNPKFRFIIILICLLFATHSILFASSSKSKAKSSSTITINSWDDWRALPANQKQLVIVFLGFYFFMIVVKTTHQLVVLVRKPIKQLDLDDVMARRAQSDLPSSASTQENQMALELLNDGIKGWKNYETENGESVVLPTKKTHINRLKQNLKKINEILPTDQAVIKRINQIISLVNSEEKRTFVGSRLILGFFILLVPIALLDSEMPIYARIIFFLIMAILSFHYFSDYRVPEYKLRQRNEKYQFHNISSRALKYLLNQILMARVYKITTFWSDGSKTVDYDISEVVVQTIIMLAGLFMIIVLFPFMMFVNYIRNYIL